MKNIIETLLYKIEFSAVSPDGQEITNDDLFILLAWHPTVGGEQGIDAVNELCRDQFNELRSQTHATIQTDRATQLIRDAFNKVDKQILRGFFCSGCIALRRRDDFVISTIGACEAWEIQDRVASKRCSQTTLPSSSSSLLFEQVLGGGITPSAIDVTTIARRERSRIVVTCNAGANRIARLDPLYLKKKLSEYVDDSLLHLGVDNCSVLAVIQ